MLRFCFFSSWYVTSSPTTDIPSRKKKQAIVQQTIGITDSVAVHQCVHYRPLVPITIATGITTYIIEGTGGDRRSLGC